MGQAQGACRGSGGRAPEQQRIRGGRIERHGARVGVVHSTQQVEQEGACGVVLCGRGRC